MSRETHKALQRRWCEDQANVNDFKWADLFRGDLIDVGCGPDPLPFPNCKRFDTQDGNAENLEEYFAPNSFDTISASHICEHLRNPEESLRKWAALLKPEGHVIMVVPDVGAYESFTFPSRYNPDHKASFSMLYQGSPFPVHYHIPSLCQRLSDIYETRLARFLEINFDWKRRDIDQTFDPARRCEIWNEVVWRKAA